MSSLHLRLKAALEFDAMAADREAQAHVLGLDDGDGYHQLLTLHKFIAGARQEHARLRPVLEALCACVNQIEHYIDMQRAIDPNVTSLSEEEFTICLSALEAVLAPEREKS